NLGVLLLHLVLGVATPDDEREKKRDGQQPPRATIQHDESPAPLSRPLMRPWPPREGPALAATVGEGQGALQSRRDDPPATARSGLGAWVCTFLKSRQLENKRAILS